MVYRLRFGVEDVGSVDGTADELCGLLDTYPDTVALEVLAMEKLGGTELYPLLLRYMAHRMVGRFED